MSDVQSVAANTTTANVLAGKQFEFAPGASIVRFYACASAVGLNLTINVGGQALVADEEISGANRFPTRDQDLLAEFGALPGERIFVQARNTTAGAITSNLLVDVLPV